MVKERRDQEVHLKTKQTEYSLASAAYQVIDRAELFAASESDMDEFGDDFYFA